MKEEGEGRKYEQKQSMQQSPPYLCGKKSECCRYNWDRWCLFSFPFAPFPMMRRGRDQREEKEGSDPNMNGEEDKARNHGITKARRLLWPLFNLITPFRFCCGDPAPAPPPAVGAQIVFIVVFRLRVALRRRGARGQRPYPVLRQRIAAAHHQVQLINIVKTTLSRLLALCRRRHGKFSFSLQ